MNGIIFLNALITTIEEQHRANREAAWDACELLIGHKIEYKRGGRTCYGMVQELGGFRGCDNPRLRTKNVNSGKLTDVDMRSVQVVMT